MMQTLNTSQYSNLLTAYYLQDKQFPLIASILMQIQEGEVYWDGTTKNFFIVHKFGFCQLLEFEAISSFKTNFTDTFLIKRQFPNNKLRWYDVDNEWKQHIIDAEHPNIALVERIQFKHRETNQNNIITVNNDYVLTQLDQHNFEEINHHLPIDLDNRFWPSKQLFFQHGFGSVLYHRNKPISICYACAIANGYSEIDIFTDENYRQQGIASIVLTHFINLCDRYNVKANWDCYANNFPSLNLANKFLFTPHYRYCHAVIEKI